MEDADKYIETKLKEQEIALGLAKSLLNDGSITFSQYSELKILIDAHRINEVSFRINGLLTC